MVQRIRLRGHVIRLYGLSPNSSRSRPKACPTCGTFYNDGSHRKCFYLCCEFDDCLDCVINRNKFHCHKFAELCRLKKIKMEIEQQVKDKETKDGELKESESTSSSSLASSQTVGTETISKISEVATNVTSADKTEADKNKCEDKGGGDKEKMVMAVNIKKEPVEKEENVGLKIDFVKILPKQWLPLVILDRVEGLPEKVKEEPVETMELVQDEVREGITSGRGRRGRRRNRGIASCEGSWHRGPGRPRGGGGGTLLRGRRVPALRHGRRRLVGRRRSTRLSNTKS